MSITQTQIAAKLGVSQPAVAFALSDTPQALRQLSTETRELIIQTAQQMGYVPHRAAQRLSRARSDNRAASFDQAGFIYLGGAEQDIDSICLTMMQGVENELSKLHASLTFVRVCEPGDWKKVERLMRGSGVDGWLLVGRVNDEVVDRLNSAPLNGIPYVILGDHRCTRPVHSVNVDHHAVGRLAVEHLASLGHRRIAILKGGTDFVYQRQILEGFRAARKELGLEDEERLAAHASIWMDPRNGGMKITDSAIGWLKQNGLLPTAMFIPEPGSAIDFDPVLKQWEVEVPRSMSVVGCGFTPSRAAGQNSTFVEWPIAEVGHQGALLLHRIAAEQNAASVELKIPPSLVKGWSTGPCNMEPAK